MRAPPIFEIVSKFVFLCLLLFTSYLIYVKKVDWVFINNANLIFHEAGHVIFSFFGDFMHVLGGTLGEVLVPLIVAVHFLINKNLYGAGFGLWWTSTAFWNISVYARDAQVQLLPLITGNSEDHDWTYLLGELGWLRHDLLIANSLLSISMFFFVCALFVFVFDLQRLLQHLTETK